MVDIKRIKKEHPSAYEPWSPELDQKLRDIHAAHSLKELCRIFGRTPGGISSRKKKLGLSRRIKKRRKKEKSKHSDAYIQCKKNIYDRKLPIISVKIYLGERIDERAEVTFNDGTDITIISSDHDFIELAFQLKTLFKDGKKEIVDLASTPAKSIETYYANVDYFTKDERDMKEITASLLKEEGKINPEVDIVKGIKACLDKKFSDADAIEILENYAEAIGLVILHMKPIKKMYDVIIKRLHVTKKNNSFVKRVNDVYTGFLKLDTIGGFRLFFNDDSVDSELLLKSLTRQGKASDQKWSALYKTTGGKLKGSEAFSHALDEYKNTYEIIKPIIALLAQVHVEEGDDYDIRTQQGALNCLLGKGYTDLFSCVNTNLRNGSVHFSCDFDDDKAVIKVYDNAKRSRKLLEEIPYKTAAEYLNVIKELAVTLSIVHLMTELIMQLKTLDSPEFKSFVVTNKCK